MLKNLIKLYVKHLLQTLKSSGFIRNFFVRKSGNQMAMFPGTSGNFIQIILASIKFKRQQKIC